jgi:UDP-N-acetylmuramyl pentapeptide phosphotransferase/UDP-N-acetylglucosamine-1-phosphate transferase
MFGTYLLWLLLLSSASYIYYKYAIKANILDTPSARSSHTVPTVRGGGIVFFIAILLFYLFRFKLVDIYFLTGFLLLSILGFIDDKKELSARVRFPFQLLAVALILYQVGLFTSNLPVLVQVVGFIAGVSFINAFNFMDGINGITGLYTLAVLAPLYYINKENPIFSNDLFVIMAIAILVFGFYNFRKKALFFAGDIGSMALAALLLFMLSKFMIQLNSPLLLGLVLVYGIDSAMTILYRAVNKENIFKPHRWHLYQKLVDNWQWSHLKVAGVYALLQVLIGFFIVKHAQNTLLTQLLYLFVALLIGVVVYVVWQGYFSKIKK